MMQRKPMTVGRFTFTGFKDPRGMSSSVTIARDGETITTHAGISADALGALLDALAEQQERLG